jgi:hypothetical protein
VLEALDHAEAVEAVDQLRHLDPSAYRGFNLVIADCNDAFWLKSTGNSTASISVKKLHEGVSMLTARELNDLSSPRIQRHLPLFESALPPDPDLDDWDAWQELMRSTSTNAPTDGMIVSDETGFETVSSSLIALPATGRVLVEEKIPPQWLFAAGRPDRFPYQAVSI